MGRGGEAIASGDPATLFAGVLERLTTDSLWATQYHDYVDTLSFAQPDERPSLDAALTAVPDLVALLGESPDDGSTDQRSRGSSPPTGRRFLSTSLQS